MTFHTRTLTGLNTMSGRLTKWNAFIELCSFNLKRTVKEGKRLCMCDTVCWDVGVRMCGSVCGYVFGCVLGVCVRLFGV